MCIRNLMVGSRACSPTRRSVINVPLFFGPPFVSVFWCKVAQINKGDMYDMSRGAITRGRFRIFVALQDVCFKNEKIPLLGGCWDTFRFSCRCSMESSREAEPTVH